MSHKPRPTTAFGTRSLSIATGLDHTTVAAHLRALREEDDPLIDLIENDRGLAGDLYQLRIPDEIAVRATKVGWKAGKLHALRPVFRELGHAAALVYEALEHTRGRPLRSFDLTGPSGLSRRAVYEALETLAAWNLAESKAGRWVIVAGTSLQLTGAAHTGTVAEQLTVTGYSSGDAKLLPTLDLGTCSPTVAPGKTYNLSTWYQSTGTTQFSLYYRDSTGAWYYWTSSPWYPTATAWTQATFTTPPVPANAVGMTFGLGLITNGTLTTDDYSLLDPGTAPAGAAPAVFASTMTVAPAVFTRSSTADPAAPGNPGPQEVHTHAHTSNLIPGQAHGQASAQPGQRITVPEITATGRKHQG